MIRSLTLSFLLFLAPFSIALATQYTSVTSGGWNDPCTWDVACLLGTPGTNDTVIVAAGHTVSLTQTESVHDFTIAVSGILYHGGYTLNVGGKYICNGNHNSSGTLNINGGPNETIEVPSSGGFNFSGTINIVGTKTVTAASDIKYMSATMVIATGDTLVNDGYVWIRGTANGADGTAFWVQGDNARVYVHNTFMSTGSLRAEATGNICYYWADTKNFSVWGASNNYNDVFMRCNNPRSLTLQTDMNVDGFFYQNSTTSKVNTNPHTITVAGNYRTFGAQFPTNHGDVDMDGAATQQIRNETTMTEIQFDDLTISGSDVQPILPIVSFNSLTVSGTFDLTSSNHQLTLQGDLTNTGTLTPHSAKILASGTNTQSWTGTSTIELRDFEVNKAAGTLTLTSGTYNIDSVFTMTAGTFNPSGNMSILSDATRTARLAEVAGGSITGSVTCQRYIGSRSAEFQNFSSPANSTLLDWDNEIFMSGVGGADGNAQGQSGIFYSVKTYDEVTDAFTDVTTTGETLDAGKGFQLFLGDDLTTFSATTIDSRGIPFQGDQGLPLTFTASNGWNLVGNPFASWIAWDSLYNNTSDIDNNFYVLNAATGSYTTYGAGDEIPSTQGFWVHATAASTLNINETSKTEGTASTFYRMPNAYEEALRFNIASKTSPFSHESVVRFSTNAAEAYEKEDALFLESPDSRVPSITTFSKDGQELNINAQSIMSRQLSVPMKANVGVSGLYDITVKGLEFADHFSCIVLEDVLTGEVYDLRENNELTVSITENEDTKRFMLHLSLEGYGYCDKNGNVMQPAPEEQITVTTREDVVFLGLTFDQEEDVRVSAYNVLGQPVTDVVFKASVINDRISLEIPEASGIYYIKVETNERSFSKKVYLD